MNFAANVVTKRVEQAVEELLHFWGTTQGSGLLETLGVKRSSRANPACDIGLHAVLYFLAAIHLQYSGSEVLRLLVIRDALRGSLVACCAISHCLAQSAAFVVQMLLDLTWCRLHHGALRCGSFTCSMGLKKRVAHVSLGIFPNSCTFFLCLCPKSSYAERENAKRL
jgi:hypothetical protein